MSTMSRLSTLVGATGFEPATHRVAGRALRDPLQQPCVGATGFEPATSRTTRPEAASGAEKPRHWNRE